MKPNLSMTLTLKAPSDGPREGSHRPAVVVLIGGRHG